MDATPEKSTPELEQPVPERPIQQPPARRDLWKEAFDSLDPSEQRYVAESSGVSATAAIQQVIDDTTAKYEQWRKGGLKIRRKDGNDISLRDCSERILGAAMKASEVISTAVSFDPTGQASSAWTIISFGMSVSAPSSMFHVANTYVNYRLSKTESTVETPFLLPRNILRKPSPTTP